MVTGAQPFVMPRLGESYINQIVDRCCDLIDTKIWDGLDKVRIHAWMRNFASPEERYFGAAVLDALIYRSLPAKTLRCRSRLMHQPQIGWGLRRWMRGLASSEVR